LPVHVGGKSALELQGLGHFVSAGSGDYLHLFRTSGQKLPSWFLRHDWNRRIAYKMPHLFAGDAELGLTTHSCSTFDIQISAPERAMLELLHLVPKEQSAEETALLMEGLGTLRPKFVQELLERCQSIKAKRLFLPLAERSNHSWVKRISLDKIDLGKGKRVVVPGGVLDPKYRDMPRLSVDIDLAYLPIEPREGSLRKIGEALVPLDGICRTIAGNVMGLVKG
jgi:Transcriptional regulator, AbiEi antitoxin, Type IV TA system